jgi:hypothetical protein
MSGLGYYLRRLTFVAVAAISAQANAQVLSWQLDQLYSNQTGDIEFIVVKEYQNRNDQQTLSGSQFASLFSAASHGHASGDVTTYLVPNDLASNQTAGKRFLISSQGFADLGIITPDYVFPNKFMASAAGTLSLYKQTSQPFDLITYPGLPQDGVNAIYRDGGTRQNMAINFAGQTATVPGTPAGSPIGQAVEYYYADWDNYFMTAFPDEQAVLDGGAFGGNWKRTGESFNIWTKGSAISPATCRFFSVNPNFVGPDGVPRSTHFYTPISDECQTVKGNADWQFEAVAFFMVNTDVNGNCPAGTTPLFRLYNNGMGGAPNHRYTTNRAVFDQMVAQGWVPEGNGPLTIFACGPA